MNRRFPSARSRLYAKGRLRAGVMNATEVRYAAELEARKAAGEIAWYLFEGVTFRLAADTRYTPDFVVMMSDCTIEIHETKGSAHVITDDGLAKWKIAGEMFPFVFRMIIGLPKRDGGGWKIRTYGEAT